MNMKWMRFSLAVVALFFSLSATADGNKYNWQYFWGHDGTYVAELDLNPLGINRIEAMALTLHRNGTVTFISEHEPGEVSSSGLGVWERLGRGKIGIGIMMYRMSEPDAPIICANLMVQTPDNCVLKLGMKLTRESWGAYTGNQLLTIEGPTVPGEEKVAVEIPVELPFKMRRVDLSEFPGAS